MPANIRKVVNLKPPEEFTVRDMGKDILRLCKKHEYLNEPCVDAFLCITLKNGGTTYIGQTLSAISLFEILGRLEIMKSLMVNEMTHTEEDN